ncbi:MAG TPA: hypothetical protein VF256_06520, partial [Streptosporangiaceae bacterium]
MGPVSKVTKVRVTGPLAPFAPEFRARLRDCGYTPLSAVNMMRLMAHLSRWLEANGLGAADLTGEQAERYAAARCAEGRTSARLPRSVGPILAMLADQGVLVLEAPAAPVSERDGLLAAFERHLLGERGLAAST